MLPVAYIGARCSATASPKGKCVVPVIGRIITTKHPVYVNGRPVATSGDLILYAGLIYPYTGGSIIWHTWQGRILASANTPIVNGAPLATIGTPTDSGGFVIEGDPGIYA